VSERRKLAESRGRKGEALAALYLRMKGWRILDRRVKTPRGEVDIVAKRLDTVAFVEVKWRSKSTDLDSSVDEYRLRRVAAAAQAVAHRYATSVQSIRIDVLLLAPGTWPRHIVNAWMP